MTKRVFIGAVALCLALPLGLSAQQAPVVQSLKGLHDLTAGYLKATAEMLDEDMYAFRPTEEVRSAGEILAHVADSQYMFCSAAAGEDNPSSESIEETATTKAQISAALEKALAYCGKVYDGMSDKKGAEMVSFFGAQRARSAVLAFNSVHNYEHYGNLVTYMRLNGMTPPSSQPSSGM